MTIQLANSISGLEKASILMMSLSPPVSSEVMRCLNGHEQEMLGAQIVRLRHVDTVTRRQVLDEVTKYMRHARQGSVGHTRTEPASVLKSVVSQRVGAGMSEPLRWMEEFGPDIIAPLLSKERPQCSALVLSYFTPRFAASVLMLIDEKQRNQVAFRLASMKPVTVEAVHAIDAAMRRKLLDDHVTEVETDLSQPARDITLGTLDTENYVERVKATAPMEFKSLEDILGFCESDIRGMLSEIQLRDICVALRVGSEELRRVVLNCLPHDSADIVAQQLGIASHVALKDIESAQRRIVESLNRFVSGISNRSAASAYAGVLAEA